MIKRIEPNALYAKALHKKKTKTEMINDRNECSVGCHVFGILGLENISKNLIEMNIA